MAPRKSVSHDIKRQAEAHFLKCATSWSVNATNASDYGIDFSLELFKPSNEISGVEVHVQLKGESRPRYIQDGRFVSVPIETQHLDYYLNQKLIPVYLVVVDTTENKGFFLDLFSYQPQLPARWKSQTTCAIRVPTSNRLEDAEQWENDIRAAHARVSSPAFHTRRTKSLIEQRHPGVVVDVTADASMTHIKVVQSPDTPFTLSFEGPHESLVKLSEQAFGRGEPVDLDDLGIQGRAAGVPTVEDQAEVPISSLHCHSHRQGMVKLEARSQKLNRSSELSFDGQWRGGSSQLTMTVGFEDNSFKIVSRVAVDANRHRSLTCDCSMDTRLWLGRQIRDVYGLSRHSGFFSILAASDSELDLHFYMDNLEIGIATNALQDQPSHAFVLAGWLAMAKLGLEELGVSSMLLPDEMTNKYVDEIWCLHTLAHTNQIDRKIEKFFMSFEGDELPLGPDDPIDGEMHARLEGFAVPLFGEQVQIGPVELKIPGSAARIAEHPTRVGAKQVVVSNTRVKMMRVKLPSS